MNHRLPEGTVYCTKYALSHGIFQVSGRATPEGCFVEASSVNRYFLGKNDWHRSWEAAVAAAEKMKARKIASLNKSIARLSSLQFREVPRQ
jgi:hypothetical protein